MLYKLCQNHRFCSYKGKYGSEKTRILTYFTQSGRKTSVLSCLSFCDDNVYHLPGSDYRFPSKSLSKPLVDCKV